MRGAYYNEHDPFAAEWLRRLIEKGLIAPGVVDERNIQEVKADDLKGFVQCHFFAGIGGWSRALRLAGWDDSRPVWTGSCPCQPFSSAGKGKGGGDDRHLWPEWFRLIGESRPPILFGEQVESAIRHGWLDLVSTDLEREGYAFGSAVLGAHSVGAPHIRQRLWFVAVSESERSVRRPESIDCEVTGQKRGHLHDPVRAGGFSGVLGNGILQGLERHGRDGRDGYESGRIAPVETGPASETGSSFWSSGEWLPCRDGKARCVESLTVEMAYGIPNGMGLVRYGDRAIFHPLVKETKNRVGRLKGYGNAIVPQVAAEFISAYIETIGRGW